MINRAFVLRTLACGVALALACGEQDRVTAGEAPPAKSTADTAFEELCQKIRTAAGGATEEEVRSLIKMGRELGRPYSAHLALKPYFEQNLNAKPAILLLAAENAFLSGDYRTAVGRYKSFLKDAESNEESSNAAARMYLCQLDYLSASDDAYQFMRQLGGKYRASAQARKYDLWFIEEARARKDYAGLAERLAIVFNDKMPIEMERLYYWSHLDWLFEELSKAQQEHFAGLSALKALIPLIRDSKHYTARANFIAANLSYFSNGFQNNKDRATPEFEAVSQAARGYVDSSPTANTVKDIFVVFTGGYNHMDGGAWNVQWPMKQDVFKYAFPKLNENDKRALLGWNYNNQNMTRYYANADRWLELVPQNAALFNEAQLEQLPFEDRNGTPELFKKQADVLKNVNNKAAVVSRTLSSSQDFNQITEYFLTQEAWNLQSGEVNDYFRNNIWPAFKGFPRPADKQIQDQVFYDVTIKFGFDKILNTPAVMLDPNFARETVWVLWLTYGQGKDKSKVDALLHSLDWVPYTQQERKHVFGQCYDNFKQWADGVRKSNKDSKDPKAAEAIKQITELDKSFHDALDPKTGEPAKAPNPLCQKLAEAELASRARNKDLYVKLARELYEMTKDFEAKKIPFGNMVLRYAATTPPEFDTLDFQLEILADQLGKWNTNNSNLAAIAVAESIPVNRKNWTRHAWNWWDTPQGDAEKVRKINGVVAQAMLGLIEKDQFSPHLFSLYRATRRGNNWNDQNLNLDVMARMIEKKSLNKASYFPEGWVHSNASSYQWLISREFQGLGKKYPHETAFDTMFAEELQATKTLDRAYWQMGRDEKRIVANAGTGILAGFEKVPHGYDDAAPGIDLADFWEWQGRCVAADANVREAWLSKIEGVYGKTRFDWYALGGPFFSTKANTGDAAGRNDFFERLKAYFDKTAEHPARAGVPFLGAVTKLTAKSLSKEELDTLLRTFQNATPARWTQNNFNETAAQLVLESLQAQSRDNELFGLAPCLWKMTRDAKNPDFQRVLGRFARGLADQKKPELATVFASSGIDILGTEMAEDVQINLRSILSKSVVDVGTLNPFKRNDPRYGIGTAQADFLSGKLQSAWENYQENRNQVTANYKELDANFCLWVIEKNTEARQFNEAEGIARLMMQYFEATPGGFEPETRARLFFNYANIAFERQEYPRARAHFERIAEAKEYDGTRAKRDAELKLAEVDRQTKNFDRAIAQLEKLAKRHDDYLQTEAYYQLALIKFDQEDYTECGKNIEQVFNRNRNHAGTRILEGKLALQTKRYEKALDLALGQATSQELLLPGRPLKVTLEDKNLSVVGQAVQIEIRAWTDGGDEEFFTLLPFGDSKTLFEGRLPTAMGKIEKGDHTLQVFGSEKVHYDFSDAFKKNHKISEARPGTLTVASNAELYVSSGKILSLEEQKERALEEMVRERIRMEGAVDPNRSQALSKLRDDNQIKPGNPINIRVIDPDRNTTPNKDKITIRVAATSGDKIKAFQLEETEPTSGIFEGSVPTAAAQAIAFASDTEEGRDPNHVISSGDFPHWSGLPDSQRPKIFNIDLNDNAALGKMNIEANVPGRKLKSFLIQTSLNSREYKTIGRWPDALKMWDGSPTVELVRSGKGDGPTTLAQFQDYMDNGYLKSKASIIQVPSKGLSGKFDGNLNNLADQLKLEWDGPGSYYILHLSAAFEQPARAIRTFKLEKKGGDWNRIRGVLAVDGQGGDIPSEVKRSLGKGVHRIDLYLYAYRHAQTAFEIVCDTDEPPFMISCPAEMFDAAKHPEIKNAVAFEPAKINASKEGGSFEVEFGANTSARALRFLIADFETDAPAIQKISLTSKDGAKILPTQQDLTTLRNNQTLEIVPGDRINITYEDPLVISKGKELHEASLTATFHNAKLSACFVEFRPGTERDPEYISMRRFKVGDKINVFINDPDMDVSDKEDVITFTARTSQGKPVTFKALETDKHSGIFIGNIFAVNTTPQRDVELKVDAGDDIIITYRDAENTDPGIPWDITYTVEQIGKDKPELAVYDVTTREISEQERAEYEKQRKQDVLGVEEQIPVTRTVVAAKPEDLKAEKPAAVLAQGPLIAELKFPALAQSARSTATIYAQTASARKKAAKVTPAGTTADTFDINVPGTIKLVRTPSSIGSVPAMPGYKEVLVRSGKNAGDALEEGRFVFQVPIKLGVTPENTLINEDKQENANRNEERVATPLSILGNDEIIIGFNYKENGAEKWITQKAKLFSDVFFNVTDRRYQDERTAAYVGETLYFRIINYSADVSDEKDSIELVLKSTSGKETKIKLAETLNHSGIFKGLLKLVYAGDKTEAADQDSYAVMYGDTLSISYAPAPDIKAVTRDILIYKGSDGKVTALTKRFKDPAIAVQTQLTLAEAYFEQAKRHRDLGQKNLSVKEIAQGKQILEEAQRDYPNSEARMQVDYLLANLSLEYASDTEDEEKVKKFYLEAISRFTDYVRTYPDSVYAPKAQFKKALTLEKMNQMDQACEEYVKLSYRYPENELVAETIARLGQYFWNKGKAMLKDSEAQQDPVESEKIKIKAREMYKTAGQVLGRLSVRFPQHTLAGKTRVLSAQCYIQSGDLTKAVDIFTAAIKDTSLDKDLIAEAMYWCGDCFIKQKEYPQAYRQFIKLTWDYPASKWSKYARGRLSEETLAKEAERQVSGEQ